MAYVDLSLLRRIFTRTTLRKLIAEGYSCIFQEMSDSFCMSTEHMTNLQKISNMYSLMRKKYRGEYFYKNTLFNRLLLGVHSLRTTTALTEIPIAGSKADFVLINGRAVVYEIKSELDNYERLNNQIDDYYKAFCYVVVVVAKGQESIAEEKIKRPYVGIMTVDKKEHCSEYRIPRHYSDELELGVIFGILRKGEFEKIIMSNYGQLPAVSQFEYYDVCYGYIEKLGIDKVYTAFVELLKKRAKVDIVDFNKVPYELRMLVYGMNFRTCDYVRLNQFLMVR